MKYIYLRGSDVAKLTGHNKYQSIEKTVNELLSRNGIQDVYVPRSRIEECLVQLKDDQLVLLRQELNLETGASLDTIESVIKSTVMNMSYSGKITEEESKYNVDQRLKDKPILQSLELGIKQDLQMKRGNIKENSNLDKIQKKKGIIIQARNSKMYTKELYRGASYCLVIRGKVDGVSDGVIVETKNRTKYLFNELRDYERVQLECYMYLTGLEYALLTEHYNDTSNEISYSHDEGFWQQCTESIIQFIDTHIAGYLES